MNKWTVLILALLMVAGVQAAEGGKGKGGPMTKEKFIAMQQKKAEASGKEFDKAKCEAQFSKMDKNGDGVLGEDEKPAGKKGKQGKQENKDNDGDE